MMIISADNQLPFPRDLVYATYRDRLSDLVPYMANVSSIRCSGKNSFLDKDNITIVENRGSLQIDANQLQEVPFLLRNPVAKIAEEFLGKQIEPNLNQMSQCIEQYLSRSTKF